MTMLMCDNDRCRFNNDRVCRSAKWSSYVEMMRNKSDGVKLRDRNPK